jgi:hypothetical protein
MPARFMGYLVMPMQLATGRRPMAAFLPPPSHGAAHEAARRLAYQSAAMSSSLLMLLLGDEMDDSETTGNREFVLTQNESCSGAIPPDTSAFERVQERSKK